MVSNHSRLTKVWICVIVILLLSTSFAQAASSTGIEGFVTRLYTLTLDRSPDSGGLSYWVKELQSSKKTGADVSLNFIFSKEFINKNLPNTEFINIMYSSFFDRQPDPSGRQFWVDRLNNGYSRKYVLAGFVNSKEFENICATYSISPGTVKLTETDKQIIAPTSKPLEPNEIVKLVSPSVVYLEAFNAGGQITASGSGFIVSADGKLMTNYHVIKGSSTVKVYFEDGRVFNASKAVGYDEGRDIIVLKIQENASFKPLKLGDSSTILTGDRVLAIGSPKGLSNTVSEGLISSRSRDINGYNFIQTSAATSSGSSGGVLVNYRAEVIGVTSMQRIDGQNLNFAIPINGVKSYISGTADISLSDLSVTVTPGAEYTEIFEVEPNDSLDYADVISSNYQGENYHIFGTITGSQYDLDCYMLTVKTGGTLILVGMWADEWHTEHLLITVRDRNGNLIEVAQDHEGGSFVALSVYLNPGVYYILVSQINPAVSYEGDMYIIGIEYQK